MMTKAEEAEFFAKWWEKMAATGLMPRDEALGHANRLRKGAATVQFVDVDGDYHVLAEGGVKTACYLDVPYNSPYVTEQPKKLCDECAERAGIKAETRGRRWTKDAK